MIRVTRPNVTALIVFCVVAGVSPPANAWWIFNETAELVEKVEQAYKDRREVENAKTAAELAEKLEKANKSTVEAVEQAAEVAADFPGTSLTGPPPTSKTDAVIEVVKEAAKWAWRKFWGEDSSSTSVSQLSDVVAPPTDAQILSSLTSFHITSSQDFLLSFDYVSSPGFAPLLMVTGTFVGTFIPLANEGKTLYAEDLLIGDVGINDSGLLAVLLPFYDIQAPPWDTGNYLGSPGLYQDAMTVFVTGANNSTQQFTGQFVYLALGPFAEIPQPGTLLLLLFGLTCIAGVRIREIAKVILRIANINALRRRSPHAWPPFP